MKTNKLLIAMAVLALAFAAYIVVDDTADSAASNYTLDADYQVINSQPYAHLTVSSPIFAAPAFVTITGDNYDFETLAYFTNTAEAYVEIPAMADGMYTATLTTKITGTISTQFRGGVEEHTVSVLATPEGAGTVTADKTTAFVGDTVNLRIVPTTGYEPYEITVNGQVIEGTSFTMLDTNVMVVVKFKPTFVNVEVTFMVAGPDAYAVKEVASGQILRDMPAVPEVIGAEFLGWFTDDGVEFDFATTPVEGDMTVYAHYGPVQPVDPASAVYIMIGQVGTSVAASLYGFGGYIPEGNLTVTVTYAYLEPEIGKYVIDSVDLPAEKISPGYSNVWFDAVDLSGFEYYSGIYSAHATFTAEGYTPAVSSEIYYTPVLEA